MSFPRYLAALVAALIGTYLAGMYAAPHVYSWGFWPLFASGIVLGFVGASTTALANTPVLSFVVSFAGGVLCSAFLYDTMPDHYKFWLANQSSHIPLLFAGLFWFINAVMIVYLVHLLRADNVDVLETHRATSEAVRRETDTVTLVPLGLVAVGIAIAYVATLWLEHQMIGPRMFAVLALLAVATWGVALVMYVVRQFRRPRNGTS